MMISIDDIDFELRSSNVSRNEYRNYYISSEFPLHTLYDFLFIYSTHISGIYYNST